MNNAENRLRRNPGSRPLQDAVTRARANLNRARTALDAANGALGQVENRINRTRNQIETRIQNELDQATQALETRITQLRHQSNRLLGQAQQLSNNAADVLANSLPGDFDGLPTRVQEATAAIDAVVGSPGVNYLAFGYFFGQTAGNFAMRALQEKTFELGLGFVRLFCPAGFLTIGVDTPAGFAGATRSLDISPRRILDALDPRMLNAIWSLRNLDVREAILEWLRPYLEAIPTNEVRLMNFGHEENPTDETFKFQTANGATRAHTFTSECTWTVPRGRTLTIGGNMNVLGDVWVQQGATLVVKGNLNVQSPPARSFRNANNPLSPDGRVCLEQGASLVVHGNLNVDGGSPRWGSVMVCSPPGEPSPITSSILCTGNVTTRYGVHPGMSVTDLVKALADHDRNLARLHDDLLEPFLTEVAPNAAKVFGPFHVRKPYLAQFATTIGFVFIIPHPGPTYPNLMVKIFRTLAHTYTVSLNFTLGENLYTHADWWFFGDGAVPVVPRGDPEALIQELSNIQLQIQFPDPEQVAQRLLTRFVNRVAQKLVEQVVATVVTTIIQTVGEVVQGGKQLSEVSTGVVDQLMNGISGDLSTLRDELEQEFELALDDATQQFLHRPAINLANDVLRQIDNSILQALLRDTPGLLVYAGQSMTIGTDTKAPPLAVGMFVARGDLRINASQTIGSLVSAEGSVEAKDLLFNPYFTYASLYLPKGGPDWNVWLTAGAELEYGVDADSGQAIEIGSPVYHPTVEAWTR